MPFLMAFIVIVVTYLIKFKQDFEKEKLEKFTLVSLAILGVFLLLAWLLS